MTDDEMADVGSQTIDAYLADTPGDDLNTDDLACADGAARCFPLAGRLPGGFVHLNGLWLNFWMLLVIFTDGSEGALFSGRWPGLSGVLIGRVGVG
ncbi:hypothetical protein [Streptomyces sp. NPDC127112]|uniref:hypothetical protein n=1 Tax=Streptomyces sp. NPDC127112 TaxID=3345364 RepID=UPI003634061A